MAFQYNLEFSFLVNDFLIQRVQKDGLSIDNYPLHNHETYEMYYLLSGTRGYVIEDQSYTLRKGELVLIDRNDQHKLLDDSFRDGIILAFNRKFLDGYIESIPQVLNIFSEIKLLQLTAAEQSFFETLLTKMLREYKKREYGYMDYMRVSLLELLLWLQRRMHEERRNRSIHNVSLHHTVEEIAQFVTLHYSTPMTLTMLAEMFYISPFHLSRLFKNVTGFNFVKYLNHVRMTEAQKLLRDSHLSVTDIARQVGFESLTHFGRVFKELADCTPSQYRAHHQG
ncbi:AraC family transcriptional regulator [Paenibacillus koleovorans]|uniref:AraC family transcriptional regulator n=1 Tax=Paenibacillus koleovorans TaxID=121608 RepID=UPI0013E4075D|nr:helix-turn-helix domain-containing protein [Paenibacillus koleovorans]